MDYQFLTEKQRTQEELSEYLDALFAYGSAADSNIRTNPTYLDENLTFLDKGVFWLVQDGHGKQRLPIYKYSTNALELLIDKNRYSYERVWSLLRDSVTLNKSYRYFPRGRYVIQKNNKVIIYCSTIFADEKYQTMLLNKLNFNDANMGIKDVTFVFDSSLHYQYPFGK